MKNNEKTILHWMRFSKISFPRRALKITPKNGECGGGRGFRGLGFIYIHIYIYIYIIIYFQLYIYIYIYISKDTMGVVQTRGVLIIGKLL